MTIITPANSDVFLQYPKCILPFKNSIRDKLFPTIKTDVKPVIKKCLKNTLV